MGSSTPLTQLETGNCQLMGNLSLRQVLGPPKPRGLCAVRVLSPETLLTPGRWPVPLPG